MKYAPYISVSVVLLLLLIICIVIIWHITGKIEMLSEQIKNNNTHDDSKFSRRTGIKVLDKLNALLEDISSGVRKNTTHLSHIMELAGIHAGAIEANLDTDEVVVSPSLYKILNVDDYAESVKFTIEEFESLYPVFITSGKLVEIFKQHDRSLPYEYEFLYSNRWFRALYVMEGNIIYGTVIDISKEVLDKQKLEFERDYDPLTLLLNRNSYREKIREKINEHPEKYGALLFCDLDNLKFVNDTYGHNIGDVYIQTAASALNKFAAYDGVIARLSGDEFVVYIHGYASGHELIELTNEVLTGIRETALYMEDGREEKIKMSVGLTCYPSDSREVDELIRYADFAMYEIKHSSKGGMRIFNRETYERDAYLLNRQNYLDIFLEEKRLKFAFQPIVDVKTREVYGYEALLRPQIREMSSPMMLINLARTQSKLYQVEKLVFETILEWIKTHKNKIGNRKIFINSISNQVLDEQDWSEFTAVYNKYIPNVVYEINEQTNTDNIRVKINRFDQYGAMVALDDCISEYGGSEKFMDIIPNFIKFDIGMIRDIGKSKSKRVILQNTVMLAHENNMKVISKGIETMEELKTAIEIGTDYIQGFYIGMPAYDLFEPSNEIVSIMREIIDS